MHTATTTAHAVEQAHDHRLYELLEALGTAANTLAADSAAMVKRIGGLLGHRRNLAGWRYEYVGSRTSGSHTYVAVTTHTRTDGTTYETTHPVTPAEAVAQAEAIITGGPTAAEPYENPVEVAITRLAAYRLAAHRLAAARTAIDDHEAAGYTGWTRYFLVTSSAGHVHRSMRCASCNPATTFAPVVALSGTGEAEAIALVGESLCTVCFPDAPVDGRPSKLKAAAVKALLAGQ